MGAQVPRAPRAVAVALRQSPRDTAKHCTMIPLPALMSYADCPGHVQNMPPDPATLEWPDGQRSVPIRVSVQHSAVCSHHASRAE